MKEKIQLNNGKNYEIDYIRNMRNLLEIHFDQNVDMSEITSDMSFFDSINILTRNGEVCGTYESFNTIYKQDDTILILSNDGSIYVEPVITDPEPIEPYIPTIEDVRSQKITYLSSTCNTLIEQGVDVEIGGVSEHFSYKIEDQNNIKDAFDLSSATNMSVPYHCDGGNCKLYTPEQIRSIYIAEKTNLTHHQTYFNQIKMYINSLDDIDSVNAIAYGDELTGEYLDNYNMIMTQASSVINILLNGGEVA